MVVFVDIDDTLIRTAGTKRIPMPKTIERVKQLHSDGHTLYLWSSGGALYAEESALELGIQDLFTAFLPKPNLLIDDQPRSEWRGLAYEFPGQN